MIGTRDFGDRAFYPDDDLTWLPGPDRYRALHKDGTPYPED